MIQSLLFFLLGFLCAGFLALMFAPALWRRAVNLTRRRIESSIPLTMSEIKAEKDAMRADFAMTTRRLEMKLKSVGEKSAVQAAEIGRKSEEIKQLSRDLEGRDRTISGLEQRVGELEARLEDITAAAARLEERLMGAQRIIQQQSEENDKLSHMYDDASFTASSRQIDLVAREAEIEKLSSDLSTARAQRRDIDAKMRDTIAENSKVRASYEAERKKTADLERRLARMMSTLSDREERLERREKELANLRLKAKQGGAASRRRDDDDDALRDQIHQLAAEVVAMSALLEPSDSPLRELTRPEAAGGRDNEEGLVSLAERIRELRHDAKEPTPPASTGAVP